MKIFTFADLHNDIKTLEKIRQKIAKEKPDIIVCAGDFAIFSSGMKSMLKHFEAFKIPMFLIPGNHETEEETEIYCKNLKFVKDIHLKSVLFENVLFIGCGGGGFTREHAPFEQSEKEFAKAIKKLKVENKGHKLVLVAHQPPYKTKLDYLDWIPAYVGSKSVRDFIKKYQPSLCITGHLHENFGKSDKLGNTKIINPGPEGQFIEI